MSRKTPTQSNSDITTKEKREREENEKGIFGGGGHMGMYSTKGLLRKRQLAKKFSFRRQKRNLFLSVCVSESVDLTRAELLIHLFSARLACVVLSEGERGGGGPQPTNSSSSPTTHLLPAQFGFTLSLCPFSLAEQLLPFPTYKVSKRLCQQQGSKRHLVYSIFIPLGITILCKKKYICRYKVKC